MGVMAGASTSDGLQERDEVGEKRIVRVGARRVVVRVVRVAVDEGHLAHRDARLRRKGLRVVENALAAENGGEGVHAQRLRKCVAHRVIDAEGCLGWVGVPVVDRPGVVGQALGEVPLGPCDVEERVAREHPLEPCDRGAARPSLSTRRSDLRPIAPCQHAPGPRAGSAVTSRR